MASLSFDKGFTRAEDRELVSLYVPGVVMPKRGKKNAAETAREKEKQFVALRKQHSAVESEINGLEHHGLNRCLDMGLKGYLRYVGYGVMSYNLHVIGRSCCRERLAEAARTDLVRQVRQAQCRPPRRFLTIGASPRKKNVRRRPARTSASRAVYKNGRFRPETKGIEVSSGW